MPLLNMLIMCGEETPMVVSVCECTDHMVDGNKKDADYVMILFQEKVEEWDTSHIFIDCLVLDGTATVQRAGAILCMIYP